MSQDDILLVDVDVEEYAITVEPVPSTQLIVKSTPDVIIMAAAGVGPTGPTGPPMTVPGILDREFPVWDTASGTWVRSTSGLVKVAAAGVLLNDVNLYRLSANNLATDNTFNVGGHLLSGNKVAANLGQANQIILETTGKILFGLAGDTNLYRGSADTLKTDDSLEIGIVSRAVAERLRVGTSGSKYIGFDFGGSGDVGGVGEYERLKFGGPNGIVGASLYVVVDGGSYGDTRLTFNSTDGSGDPLRTLALKAGKLWIGSVEDVNLYRQAANNLRTDDRLTVSDLEFLNPGSGVILSYSTFLGYPAVKAGPTTHIVASLDLIAREATPYQVTAGYIGDVTKAGLAFGSANDVNLFRDGADILKTNDSLVVGAGLALGGNTPPAAGSVKFGDGTIQSSAYSKPSYGTVFPSSPVDGQEHILVDSLTAPTFQWRFRWNASSTHPRKWEYVGGASAHHFIGGEDTIITLGAVYADLGTIGPRLTGLPNGDYKVEASVSFRGGAQPDNMFAGVCYGASGSVGSGLQIQWTFRGTNGDVQTFACSGYMLGVSGGEIRMRYAGNDNQEKWHTRSLIVTPIRVA